MTETLLPGVPGHRWQILHDSASLLDADGKLVWRGVRADAVKREIEQREHDALAEALRECVSGLELAIDCIGDESILVDLRSAATKARAALGE